MEQSTATSEPTQRQLAYVIYDFEIGRGIKDNLIAARSHFEELSDATVRVEFPDPKAVSQGEIWSNIVRPKLAEASHVIAYIDKPNANVGFEIGYALGLGSRNPGGNPALVALALHAKAVPEWLKKPPFVGFNAVQFRDERALIATIEERAGFDLRECVELGSDLLFLCPESGGKYEQRAAKSGKWRTLSGSGWALKELPKKLQGVGAVVWMIPPTIDERDGPENTALSVVAGFVEACGIELKILLHIDARGVLDILPESLPVSDLDEFTTLIDKLKEDLVQHIAERARSKSMPPSIAEPPPRPDVGDLPTLPHAAELKDRFIGRQRWLEDYYGALEGLRARWTRALSGGLNPVQLFWYHGLGGMGKTTLLRKAMVDTAERYPEARVAYWEWDRDLWREPLDRPPDSAEDVFVAIAYRLAQLYGVETLDPYWRVEVRIRSAAAQASQARARFHAEYNDWLIKGQASSALRPTLDSLGLLRMKKELSETDGERVFRRWIKQGGFELKDQEGSLDRTRLRRDALLSCLTKLCQQAPLLLVFDTCEVLSTDAEQALRSLLVEICDRRKPVLVLIASRLAPDVGVISGSKDTWRDSLGDDRLKIERFDDLTLTTTEIEYYLQRCDPTLEEPEELAQELQRITLGVPLALRVLVEMEGGPRFLRDELTAWKEQGENSESRDNALYDLYETMADRFLWHVHDDEDLRAILALAITTDASKDLLMTYWGGRTSWSERLRELARRYSLLNVGDLHPVVRRHLRRSLRAGKYHEEIKAIAQALTEIATRTPAEPPFDERYFQRRLARINLDTWTKSDPSTLDIAPAMAMAMAYEQRLDSWILLAAELAEARQQLPGRSLLLELQRMITTEGRSLSFRDFVPRYRWMTALSSADLEECFEWLGKAERHLEWSKDEKTALHVLRALHARGAPDALLLFAKAVGDIASDCVPLVTQIGEALFELAHHAWQKKVGTAEVEKSLTLALRINYQRPSAHAALGDLLRVKKRFNQARDHYAAASELEPNNPSHLVNLADLSRLERKFGNAVGWLDKTLAVDSEYAWAYNQRGLIAQDQKQYDAAIAGFEKAHELEPKEPAYLNNLADCYRRQKQYDKASEWVDKTLAADAEYASAYNQRGLIAQDQKQYDAAIAGFEKAHELEPKEPAYLSNLADCYRQQKQYDKASEWVDRTLAADAEYAWAYDQRGLIAQDQKQYDAAIAGFEKAHELDPKEPAYLNNLADCHRQQKQYDKASEWVDRTLAADPEFAWAYNQRGLIARDQKQYDAAIAGFEKAHELEPKEPAYLNNLADCYRRQKQYDKASEWVDKTLAADAEYASAYNQRGLIAQDQKQYDAAIAGFEKAHELEPKEPAYLSNLADCYRRQKQYDKASKWVDRTLAADAEYASAYNQRGLIARDQKQYDAAIAGFEKAHELEPKEPAYLNNLADCHRQQKHYDKASEWVNRTLAADPEYAWAYNQRGLIAQDQKQYDAAIAGFEKAHELEPKEPAYLSNPADCYRQQKQYDKASEWVDKTLAADAEYASAYNQRGLIARDQKQYDAAIAGFEKAHELDPKEPAYLNNLADCHRRQKQYDKASEWVDRTLAADAEYAWAYNQRGLIAQDQKQYDAAIAGFEKAHELEPKEPAYLNNLADCYRRQKQYDKASEWVDRTLAADAEYASAYNQRGLIARDQKQYDAAIAGFEKAHELDPKEPAYLNNLADCHRQQKHYDKASEWVNRTLAADPEYASAYNQRGLIAQVQKQYDAAIAGFEKAHELEPKEPAYLSNLADCYRQQKQYDKASEWVDRTLAADPEYAWAYNERGLIAQDQKQYEISTSSFKKACELEPSEEEFAYQVGWSLLEELKYAESEFWAQKALGLNTGHIGAQNLLGAIAYLRRRWAEAKQIFQRLAATDSSHPILYCNVASACMRLGHLAEAQEEISVALQIDGEQPDAIRLLATLHHLTDRPEAVQLAQRALDLEKNFHSLLLFALTRPASISSTEPNDALDALKQALEEASRLDREQDFDLFIYALRVLQIVHGVKAIQGVVLGNKSPVWEALRQAITHVDQLTGATLQDPVVAAIVAAIGSQLSPKEQLLAAWAAAGETAASPE